MNADFKYYGQQKNEDVPDDESRDDLECLPFLKDIEIPVIEQAGRHSSTVNFIISGQIHVMNKDGLYDYGTIGEGGYFGDISCLLDEPENFSYFFNPYSGKPTLVLSLSAKLFKEICDQYPVVKDVLIERAQKRKEMFENFKSIILIKYMRTIVKTN